jgi:hypothetical protein
MNQSIEPILDLSGLAEAEAQSLRDEFEPLIRPIASWRAQAQLIIADASTNPRAPRKAKELRMEIVHARQAVTAKATDFKRQLKASIESRVAKVDSMSRLFESHAKEIEAPLYDVEKAEEIKRKNAIAALCSARTEALSALGCRSLPSGLGEMAEETWAIVVEDARLAKAMHEKIAREEEEAKIEAERILLEKRDAERKEAARLEGERLVREAETAAENARLRVEKEALEATVRAEREEADAILAVERGKVEAQERSLAIAAEDTQKALAEINRRKAADEELQRQAAEDVARAAMAPEREKLHGLAILLLTIEMPVMDTEKGRGLAAKIKEQIEKLAAHVQMAAEKL